MDVFDGDRRLRTDGVFSEQVAPFPETSFDFLYPHDPNFAAVAPSSLGETEIIAPCLRQNLPPQKLRPIRCSARFATDSGAVPGFQEADVGFFSGGGCGVGPSWFVPTGDSSGQGSGVQSGKRNMERFPSEEELSSSDDSDYASLDVAEPMQKRKKTKKGLEILIENMVAKVMERQEQMCNRLVQMIERMERERIIREEAWWQERMERLKEKEKLTAEQITRSTALIALIEKTLGDQIPEQPELLKSLCLEEHEASECRGQIQDKKDLIDEFDLNNRKTRWPKSEVQALIALRTTLDHKFQAMGSKGVIWEEISHEMMNMGYQRSAKKCKEKWENINKYFKKTAGKGKKRPQNGKTCVYFQELDFLYRNRFICNSGYVPKDMDIEGDVKPPLPPNWEQKQDGLDAVNVPLDSGVLAFPYV